MLANKPYGDVSAALHSAIPKKLHRNGLGCKDLVTLAELLDVELRLIRRKKDYTHGATGILGVKGGKMAGDGHWVVLKSGTVIDPADSTVWTLEDYCKKFGCRSVTLLQEVA